MLDLFSGGCRIKSLVLVEPGTPQELYIFAPDLDWSLMIEAASVQWVSGHMFGLAFFRITETNRLGRIIGELRAQTMS